MARIISYLRSYPDRLNVSEVCSRWHDVACNIIFQLRVLPVESGIQDQHLALSTSIGSRSSRDLVKIRKTDGMLSISSKELEIIDTKTKETIELTSNIDSSDKSHALRGKTDVEDKSSKMISSSAILLACSSFDGFTYDEHHLIPDYQEILISNTYLSLYDAIASSCDGDTIVLGIGHHWENSLHVVNKRLRIVCDKYGYEEGNSKCVVELTGEVFIETSQSRLEHPAETRADKKDINRIGRQIVEKSNSLRRYDGRRQEKINRSILLLGNITIRRPRKISKRLPCITVSNSVLSVSLHGTISCLSSFEELLPV